MHVAPHPMLLDVVEAMQQEEITEIVGICILCPSYCAERLKRHVSNNQTCLVQEKGKRRKRGHPTFSWGACLEYHSGRKFESASIWQKNPLRAGHRAGSLNRSCPPREAASELRYRAYFQRLGFVFNWLCWSDPC